MKPIVFQWLANSQHHGDDHDWISDCEAACKIDIDVKGSIRLAEDSTIEADNRELGKCIRAAVYPGIAIEDLEVVLVLQAEHRIFCPAHLDDHKNIVGACLPNVFAGTIITP